MELYKCQCRDCLADASVNQRHSHLNLLLSRLDKQQRRWVAAWELRDIPARDRERALAEITGIDLKSIPAGMFDLHHLAKVGRWANHTCKCKKCLGRVSKAIRDAHDFLNALLSHLNEAHRRWFIALQSLKIGHGGDRQLSLITGMNVETIRRGRRELEAGLRNCPPERVRQPRRGRPRKERIQRS